jgi:uncharacterized glyoxalase superfamily protein PhnB
VCAVSFADVCAATAALVHQPIYIVNLHPTRLDEIWADIARVADVLDRAAEATAVVHDLQARVSAITRRPAASVDKPRVVSIEWLDSVMVGGLWMPELIARAGGIPLVTRPGDHAPTLTRGGRCPVGPSWTSRRKGFPKRFLPTCYAISAGRNCSCFWRTSSRPRSRTRVQEGVGRVRLGRTTPILRIFDEAKAREFYVDFLGFKVDWEHRFEPGLPLYMQVSKDGCVLHLSEHHGDCSPGAAMRIETSDLDAFHAVLASKRYKYARPGIEEMPWGTRDMSVKDPFGNRLTFTTFIDQGT